MRKFIVKNTKTTPSVYFDAENGKISINGRSINENPEEFYKPLDDYIKEYSLKPNHITEVNIQLEYLNAGTTRCMLNIFRTLEDIIKECNKKVVINWYYDKTDEDMAQTGKDYQSLIDIPLKLIKN